MYLISIPPSYWERRWTRNHKYEADFAVQVTQHILLKQNGPMDDPETWVPIAEKMDCQVFPFYLEGGKKGEYTPWGDGGGAIVYNTAYSPPAQARILVHEIAHHLLMPFMPGYLFGEGVECHYDGNPGDIRERIAKRVEELCFRRLG